MLSNLPKEFGWLFNLEELYLQNNPSLTQLPSSIENLHKLRIINLYYCSIESIPESFGELVKLKELLLFSNKIKEKKDQIGSKVNFLLAL